MAKSLQEQLLGAGLVDEKKAKQIKQQKRKKAKQEKHLKRHNKDVKTEAEKRAEEQAKAREEKAKRDRELNEQRKAEAQQKELQAQVNQIIEQNLESRDKVEVDYNFTHDGVVKQLGMSKAQQKAIANGRLAIAEHGSGYALISREAAAKVQERNPAVIVVLYDEPAEPDEDDPYAGYEVPDDLMW